MSSIHALQRSTTSEKLLKSVRALRPFLCESLQKYGFDPCEYINAAEELDVYLQVPHDGNVKDTPNQGQNCGNPGGNEKHGMPTCDMNIYEQDDGDVQCHVPHGDLVADQYIGCFGHESNTPNRSAYMPESRVENQSSLEPSTCLHNMPSLTSLGSESQDVCHDLYLQEFQHYPQCPQDINDGMASPVYSIDLILQISCFKWPQSRHRSTRTIAEPLRLETLGLWHLRSDGLD